MSDYLRTQTLPYQSTSTTAPPGEWTGPKTISTPPLTHYLCATTVAHYFFPHPNCETTGFSGQSTSLAPSSQCTVPQSSSPGVKRRSKMTERGRPYDIGHHFRSKASVARVKGASDESCPAASFACPGEDSLEYAEGLALAGSSCSSRTGGEFGCISVICQSMTLMQSALKRHWQTFCKSEAATQPSTLSRSDLRQLRRRAWRCHPCRQLLLQPRSPKINLQVLPLLPPL